MLSACDLGSNGPIRVDNGSTLRAGIGWACSQAYRETAEEANFKPMLSFFTSVSTAEAHVCGVKFIGFYTTAGFIAIRDFSFCFWQLLIWLDCPST